MRPGVIQAPFRSRTSAGARNSGSALSSPTHSMRPPRVSNAPCSNTVIDSSQVATRPLRPSVSASAIRSLAQEWKVEAVFAGTPDRRLVPCVRVPHDARSGIVPQYPLDPASSGLCSVTNDDYAGMLGIAHPHAAAMGDGYPARTAGGVEKRIQKRPVGHRVRAIEHGLRFAIRAGYRAGVQVVAPNDNRRAQLATGHHLVESQSQPVSVAQSHPADASREALAL